MSYLQLTQDQYQGDFGFGSGCQCSGCRQNDSGVFSGATSVMVQPARPIFNVECPAGCDPVTAGECRNVVRRAVYAAIKLANNAAIKVDAARVLPPDQRDADARRTARLYTFFFGHDPTRPIAWAGNQASGVSVAIRFRSVAKELGGGRRITFRCLATRADCADADLTCCLPGSNAWVNQALVPNVVHLCAGFWNPPADLRGLPPTQFRAGTIVHEMLHLLFPSFLLHQPPGRPNAHCYEAFALRVAGFGASPRDVRLCRP